MSLRHRLVFTCVSVVTAVGCYIGNAGNPPRACETSECGCFDKQHMLFTGVVMDNDTFVCIPFKLVRLKDRDGRVVAEDSSKSFGGYQLEGDVDRSPHCPGGEPVIRDLPDGGDTPQYAYLPRRTPVDAGMERVDLFRVPFGTQDAGVGQPVQCRPPPRDGGTNADGG